MSYEPGRSSAWIEYLLGVQGVTGSNPAAPTDRISNKARWGEKPLWLFYIRGIK